MPTGWTQYREVPTRQSSSLHRLGTGGSGAGRRIDRHILTRDTAGFFFTEESRNSGKHEYVDIVAHRTGTPHSGTARSAKAVATLSPSLVHNAPPA